MEEQRKLLDKLCPMCKQHKAIAVFREVQTEYKGVMVSYPCVEMFCSVLGEDDEDAYFMTGPLWNTNRQSLKASYLRTDQGQTEQARANMEYGICNEVNKRRLINPNRKLMTPPLSDADLIEAMTELYSDWNVEGDYIGF